MLYMVTFTINIPPMLAYIPDMDPMGSIIMNCNDAFSTGYASKPNIDAPEPA